MAAENLHEALSSLGITSAKDEKSFVDKRSLYAGGKFIGAFDAHEAWILVNDLREAGPYSLAETFHGLAEAAIPSKA